MVGAQIRIMKCTILKQMARAGLMIFCLGASAQAKDLTNRLGIGYKNQFAEEVPGISLQYYPTSDYGISGTMGLDTEKDNSKFGMMFKFYRIVFTEKNMNFFMGAGAGLLSSETAGKNSSGFELNGFVGGEFFLPGLDNLGFMFEAGLGVLNRSNGTRFRSYGDSPLRAGMNFYF